MSKIYTITGEVADGAYDLGVKIENYNEIPILMDTNFTYCEMSHIHFYSDDSFEEASRVTPTGGDVLVRFTSDNVEWRDVVDGQFSATDAYASTRNPPRGNGLAVNAQVTLSGVAGATHFKATIWRA